MAPEKHWDQDTGTICEWCKISSALLLELLKSVFWKRGNMVSEIGIAPQFESSVKGAGGDHPSVP